MVDLLLQPLDFAFMWLALATTVVAAVVSALLSCWLVLVGWSLMGDAVSHAVLPGVVLAYLFSVPFALGALVFGLLAVALIGVVGATSRVKEDAAIGIVFTTLFALGLVLVSVTPSSVDLTHILFGNLLGVGYAELAQVVILGVLAFAVLLAKRRDLVLWAFDPVHAHAIGLRPAVLRTTLLVLLAVTSVVALQAVGVVLVVAMLIVPGAAAHLLTDSFGRMLLIAPALSAGCAVIGLYASYYGDIAPGGAIVLALGGVFAAVYLLAPRHGVLARSR